MAEKGEAEIPTISLSTSREKSDPDQDPAMSDPLTDILNVFRQEEEEEEKEEEESQPSGYIEDERRREKEEEKDEKEEDTEIYREAKRRKKNCPASLEKSLSSNRGFSFSFDTMIGPIESTPKFGSFNLGLGGSDFDGIPLGLGLGLRGGYEEEEKKEGVIAEERGREKGL